MFHASFESEAEAEVRTYFVNRAEKSARTKTDSLLQPKKHKITPKWAYQRLLQSQNRPKKFLKIYTDVLHDMVVDYRV